MEAIPEEEFVKLTTEPAGRPGHTATLIARAFEQFIRSNVSSKGLLVLLIETVFGYHAQLSLLRALAADQDRLILLLPGKREDGDVILFPKSEQGDYTLPGRFAL